MKYDFIKYDTDGYPYNGMYPPKGAPEPAYTDDRHGYEGYEGYTSPGKAAFFYDYAVQLYDIDFKYNGVPYRMVTWDGDYFALLNESGKELQSFDDEMDAILRCEIDGKKLIDILDDLTDLECG